MSSHVDRSAPVPNLDAASVRHLWYEDALAFVLGSICVSLGVTLYAKATLLTSGVAGLSLLLSYTAGRGFDFWFFAINLPFYGLALWRMGWRFALRTLGAVSAISLLSKAIPTWLDIVSADPLFAAIAGGGLIGLGALALLRHKSGIGGFNIFCQYLQERYGINAGYTQMTIDMLIMLSAFLVGPDDRVGYSIVGALALNLVLALNHRPGRYTGFS